jgi:hypothetical protein
MGILSVSARRSAGEARPAAGQAGEFGPLRLDRPTIGVIEDHTVLLEGLPPVLGRSREAVLRPQDR